MVKPAAQRQAAAHVQDRFALSERRACRLIGCWRSTVRYRPRSNQDTELRQRMEALAQKWRRAGYRQLGRYLRREGWRVNDKRVYRLYKEAGLVLKRRLRKRIRRPGRRRSSPTQQRHECWAMDFIHDRLIDGRRFRVLGVMDIYTRECLRLEVDFSLPSERVVRVLDDLDAYDQLPGRITVDNGPEFTSAQLSQWLFPRHVDLDFIEPGKPTQNAFIESFNRTLRDECLNQNWFASMPEARQVIEAWRNAYNEERPHSSLAGLTPAEFAQKEEKAEDSVKVESQNLTC